MEVGADDWFVELIKLTAVAGGCSKYAKIEPAAARGLNKTARRSRAKATILLNQWLVGVDAPADTGDE